MYETPSLHKFGYSSEQLKLREYQELKDMIKSQDRLAQITHSKLKEDLQRDFENELENLTIIFSRRCLAVLTTLSATKLKISSAYWSILDVSSIMFCVLVA